MSNNPNPENLVNNIDNLFGGAPVILFLGANCNIQQFPELLSRPWSGVVTSSRDTSLTTLFVKNNPREIVNANALKEKLIFNRKLLPIIYLNGIADETNSSIEDYDVKIQQEETRDALLTEFVKSINATFGTVILTGYVLDEKEEIPADTLYKSFRNLNHQAIWFFGVDENNLAIKNLILKQIAKSYPYNVGEIFRNYGNDYNDEYDEDLIFNALEDENEAYSIYVNGKSANIGESTMRGFLPFGRLLTISDMSDAKVSYSMMTEWFYKFLKDSSSEPQWYGYDPRWQFYFKRDFEEKLFAEVKSDIEKGQDKPVVLCGQTCSGKSIALAALAWRLFHEKYLPVVYIQNPNLIFTANAEWTNALSILIDALNVMGAEQVVVIWDSSFYNLSRDERLLQLQTIFKNRGKKLVIVASAMKQQFSEQQTNKLKSKYNLQNATVKLSENECKLLKRLLVEKGKIPQNALEKWFDNNEKQENLLALLYKLIFQIHSELELSLSNEIYACLKDTKETLEELPPQQLIHTELNAIGLQLYKLGLIPTSDTVEDSVKTVDWKARLDAFYQQLAVCSRFNLDMPVTIAMRLLDINDVKYRNAVFNAPSFKFYEDTKFHPGEYTVSFRTPVEAEMYLANVSEKTQYEIIADIIRKVSDNFYASDVEFIVRLLRIVGPNSEVVKNNYENCPIIINALKELRESDIFEPGLIIQEVVYIREYYGPANPKFAELDLNMRIKKLKDAVKLSKCTLNKMEKGLYSQSTKNSLSVEFVLGWLALRDTYKNEAQKFEIGYNLLFDESYELLSGVIYETPNNSYAYVALIRLINAKMEDKSPDIKSVYRYAGFVMELIDDVDANFPDVSENEAFISARNRFYQKYDELFGSRNTDQYCEELLTRGLAVGLYLKAFNLLRKYEIKFSESLEPRKQDKCKEIIDILDDKEYADISAIHPGCQFMLLRLKYLYYNTEPMFSGSERQATRLNKTMWQEILSIANAFTERILPSNPQLLYKNKIYYIQALAYAQLGQYSAAENVFTKINEENFYTPIRAKTWHLICDEHGTLIEFTGRFRQPDPRNNGKGYLRINGFEKGVHYTNIGYLQATGKESVLDNLCVGLSFIGFVAYSKNHSLISGRR